VTAQVPDSQVVEMVAAATIEEPDRSTLRTVRDVLNYADNGNELAAAMLSDEV